MDAGSETHPPCNVLSFLVADKVFREEDSRKAHIAGVLNRLAAADFPAMHPTLAIYAAFVEATIGSHRARVEFGYADTPGQVLCAADGPVEVKDRRRVHEMNFHVRGLVLPRPGTIEVRLFMDGCYLTRWLIEIEKAAS